MVWQWTPVILTITAWVTQKPILRGKTKQNKAASLPSSDYLSEIPTTYVAGENQVLWITYWSPYLHL